MAQYQSQPLAYPSRKHAEAASSIVPTTATTQISSSSGDAPMAGDVASGRSRVVMHQDSGIRLPREGEEEVVEVPPLYTPG
jgi:hypothetical protein